MISRLAFSVLLLALIATYGVQAQTTQLMQRARDPAGLALIQQHCKAVTSHPQMAECLWAALRANKVFGALINTHLMEDYFANLVRGDLDRASCKAIVVGYPSVPNSPGHYEATREVLQRLHKVKLPAVRECQEANALYREFVGIAPSWEKCSDRPYDYQHFEDCLVPTVVGREGAEAAIRRFYERAVSNPETDAVFSTAKLAQSLATYAYLLKERRNRMMLEANLCISSNRTPFSAQQLYAKAATANLPEPQPGQTGGPYEQRASQPTCADVIRFTIKFKIIEDPSK